MPRYDCNEEYTSVSGQEKHANCEYIPNLAWAFIQIILDVFILKIIKLYN